MNRSDPQIESAAQIIYAVVQQHSHEGARYPWQDGGNSLVQDLCRDAARKILTTPTTAGEPVGIDLREQAARIIYDEMRRLDSVGRKFPWQDGGNSDAQTVARLAAVKVLKLTTPATAGEPMAWIGHAPEPYGDMVTLDAERAARWPRYGVNVTPLYAHTAPAPDQQSVETCEVCEGKGYVTAFQNARLSVHPCPRGCTEPLAAAPREMTTTPETTR